MQAGRAHKQTQTPTPQHRVAGHNRDASPSTTPRPHTPARSGGVQAEHAHKPTHTQAPEPGVAGCSRNPSRSTHTQAAHPSQEWRGASRARTQAYTHPDSPARSGRAQQKPEAEHTHQLSTPKPGVAAYKRNRHISTHRAPTPQPGVAGCSRNPNPTTTQTQTQAPGNSRKPSVYSPGTEAARAMQVTRPNEIRRPGVTLHPKACAALGLEAERGTPKHLGTLVPRTCMHALGYARKSGEPPGFCPKEGTCASTGAHPPGMTSSHAGGDQPSRCCLGPLCWGPPVRSSRM